MFNTKWDLHVKACWASWHSRYARELGFLEDLPTYHAYLAIIALAKSVNLLENLHNMLPDNVRLLRDDFKKLRDFWQYYFTGKTAEKCHNQLMEWVLWEMSTSWKDAPPFFRPNLSIADSKIWAEQRAASQWSTATRYYLEKIRAHETGIPLKHFFDSANGPNDTHEVFGCQKRYGKQFYSWLFGSKILTEFHVTKGWNFLMARFIFREAYLTEKVTHGILTLPPYYLFKHNIFLGDTAIKGRKLFVGYEMETGDLIKHLGFHNPDIVIADDQFLALVAETLRGQGIPVVQLVEPNLLEEKEN